MSFESALKSVVFAGLVAAAVVPGISGAAPANDGIPNFTPAGDTSWQVNFWDYILPAPPGAAHGPILTDPKYPYNSQIQNGGLFRGGDFQVAIVNAKDPVLKPWAAKQMEERNQDLLAGKRTSGFVAQSRCWPGGVPGQNLFLEPVYFLQKPNEVIIMWQRNNIVRRVKLTDKHSAAVKPTWFGESIGHYENGDTLVVDTVGIAGGKYHTIDNFGTPHTDKLHTVERFTIAKDGNTLNATITVEDPDTFNAPLTLRQEWRRTNLAYEESICAEDGGMNPLGYKLEPIPVAAKADF